MSTDGRAPSRSAEVHQDLVDAALNAARRLDKDIADVSVQAIAEDAGISRSTLLRRLGGTRHALDAAVRAAGIDPGGRRPVRDRAVEAGARLVGELGLAAFTVEAVAAEAGCSIPSLYATFTSRDGLLLAVYDRYSPTSDVEAHLNSAGDDLAATLRTFCRLIGENFQRQPRVLPAILAEILARPQDPAIQSLLSRHLPWLLDGAGAWLGREIRRGRIRDLPVPLLLQQLIGPVLLHALSRPVDETLAVLGLPEAGEAYDFFADNFLRAVGIPGPDGR
ncbi:TetR/AcrR family transcriptional regulator [Amycolatopsis jiangsuensis]|uniref:AcrR family transcriptional regulator n=1 Tax=Amycolatopsis jiangsuensis TaxID=1181879 RepID=A0A840J8J5_9PSEU|nr:TetR/AcrR family transcriptional regulator [Amycolatopsis jiangsuensis]MBB4689742.1 AcrR family transcriptional regulator [Amycolatopsis jiangsuensis]